MITIIGKGRKFISLSAPRDTHLKALETFAGAEFRVCNSPHMCIPDADIRGNLVWTLERRL